MSDFFLALIAAVTGQELIEDTKNNSTDGEDNKE